MIKLILLRHGESLWNKENRFTGWTDIDLSDTGLMEAHNAGSLLKKEGILLNTAFTSVLKRAVRTLEIVLKEMGQTAVPVKKSWRLNERHYGALQGLNKQEMINKFGEDKVHIWRRSYDVRPPEVSKDDSRYPGNDPLYKDLKPEELPLSESLKDTMNRFLPYWQSDIKPVLMQEKNVLIAAHGNTIRALVKLLDNISDRDISEINISTGVPLIYELNSSLAVIKKYML